MKNCLVAFLLAWLGSTSSVWARAFTVEEKITDFRGLVGQMKSGYGPLEYKKEKLGLDIDVLQADFETLIRRTKNNRDFYYLIPQFIAKFRDGHFNSSIPTDHKKELPFTVDLVRGRVLLDTIDTTKLSATDFPFQRGDEVLVFDGAPVDTVVKTLMNYIQSGREASVRRMAVWAMTVRRGSRLPVPAQKTLGELQIRHAQTGRIDTVKAGTIQWSESGTPLDEFDPGPESLDAGRSSVFSRHHTNYGDLSVRDIYEDFLGSHIERSFACNAGTRIHIPDGATVLMNPPDKGPFTAYYHYDARFGGNVGYLRIPDYSPKDKAGNNAYEERFSQYEFAVRELEKNTVALVIDQDHNCGGSVEYLERLLGLFFTEPYLPMQFRLMASKESFLDVKSWVEDQAEYTLARANEDKVLSLVKESFESGVSRLTPITSITGIGVMNPNPVHYTKPIVVLVDEIAGSGGDAFPSILGFQRARLVGTASSGLGGHVGELAPLFFSRIGGRVTKSMFFRGDGEPVENNGAFVAAENEYLPSYNDFVDGYREYQEFYLNRLLDLLKKQASPER